jgi:hypothetical protein
MGRPYLIRSALLACVMGATLAAVLVAWWSS